MLMGQAAPLYGKKFSGHISGPSAAIDIASDSAWSTSAHPFKPIDEVCAVQHRSGAENAKL